MKLTSAMLTDMKKKIQGAPAAAREVPEELYDLGLLGIWARDTIMPLLRKLPPKAEVLLPNPDKTSGEPISTTVEVLVAEAFKACPQKS